MLNDGDKGAILQRDRQTYGIAPHMPCGVVTPATLRKLADTLALRVETHEAVQMVEKLVEYYQSHAQPKERMGKTIERLGISHLEEALSLDGNG